MTQIKAVYYKIASYQSGVSATHYSCYMQVFDEDKKETASPFNDVFQGKWSKCKTVINKWQKIAAKNKLQRL